MIALKPTKAEAPPGAPIVAGPDDRCVVPHDHFVADHDSLVGTERGDLDVILHVARTPDPDGARRTWPTTSRTGRHSPGCQSLCAGSADDGGRVDECRGRRAGYGGDRALDMRRRMRSYHCNCYRIDRCSADGVWRRQRCGSTALKSSRCSSGSIPGETLQASLLLNFISFAPKSAVRLLGKPRTRIDVASMKPA